MHCNHVLNHKQSLVHPPPHTYNKTEVLLAIRTTHIQKRTTDAREYGIQQRMQPVDHWVLRTQPLAVLHSANRKKERASQKFPQLLTGSPLPVVTPRSEKPRTREPRH